MKLYTWPKEQLDQRDIPMSEKNFLTKHGLPIWTDYPNLEFGPYDSDGRFVIGQCGQDPIIMKEPSGEVVIELEDGSELYMNSRVSLIPNFIDFILGGSELHEERSTMESVYPYATGSISTCFWEQVLCDCELQGFHQ